MIVQHDSDHFPNHKPERKEVQKLFKLIFMVKAEDKGRRGRRGGRRRKGRRRGGRRGRGRRGGGRRGRGVSSLSDMIVDTHCSKSNNQSKTTSKTILGHIPTLPAGRAWE